MSAPEVSVVIPTRSRLGLLVQTMHTVLSQDVDLEVIVVDDASSDETPQWLAAHLDPRVRTVRHEVAAGLSHARNAGAAVAAGRWLAFVDDDDLWLPGKLAAQLAAARAAGTCWAFGGALTFTDGPRLLWISAPTPDVVDELPWRNIVPGGGSNAVVTREAFERVGGASPGIDIVADWDLWIRLHELAPPAVVERVLMGYRIHGGAMSTDVRRMLAGIDEIDRRYRHLRDGRGLDWDIIDHWLWLRTLLSGDRMAARWVALQALRRGRPQGLRLAARSLVPVPPRMAVTTPLAHRGLLDRVRPRPVIAWPDDSRAAITEALGARP